MILSIHHGWIGVDLDGTLAKYEGSTRDGIGDPVPLMQQRVLRWLVNGKDVRIFTARVGQCRTREERQVVVDEIDAWCMKHLGQKLPVTATKNYAMRELWDDRCVQVEPNTGRRMDGRGDQ